MLTNENQTATVVPTQQVNGLMKMTKSRILLADDHRFSW